MQASIALVVGIVVGAIALFVAARVGASRSEPSTKVTVLGWSALGSGLAAFLAGALMMAKDSDARVSIALAIAALVVCLGAVFRHERRWPTWVGLGAALIPALFWVFFVAAEFVAPH